MTREFCYKNKMGMLKKLVVYEEDINEKGEMRTAIRSMPTDELCSTGYNTKKQISNFLKNYGITY